MRVLKIKHFPCELHITSDNGEVFTINYDGCQGEYTRQQWSEDDIVSQFDNESQEEILRELDNSYNGNFFAE